MDSSKKSASKFYSNSEKVRICRLFLLGPVALVILVCFILLITMRLIPQMRKVDASDSVADCVVISCTAKHQNNMSSEKLCSSIEISELLRPKRALCLQIDFRSTTDEVDGRNGTVLSPDEPMGRTCTFCYEKPSRISEAKTLEGSIYFLENWGKNISLRCVIRYDEEAKLNKCSATKESKGELKMEKNTKVICLLLSVFLPLFLVGILIMCVFTPRLIKVCCHLCYDEEA